MGNIEIETYLKPFNTVVNVEIYKPSGKWYAGATLNLRREDWDKLEGYTDGTKCVSNNNARLLGSHVVTNVNGFFVSINVLKYSLDHTGFIDGLFDFTKGD